MNAGSLLIGHGHWRWLLLAVLALVLVRMLVGVAKGGAFGKAERIGFVVARVASYVQLFMGLALVGLLGSGLDHARLGPHMGAAILGIAALEIGSARAKRAEDPAVAFKTGAIGSGVALALFFLAASLNT